MKTTGINQVIKDFNALVPEEQEFTLDIIRKIMIESKREALSKRAQKAAKNHKSGKVKQGTVKDLYKDLESD